MKQVSCATFYMVVYIEVPYFILGQCKKLHDFEQIGGQNCVLDRKVLLYTANDSTVKSTGFTSVTIPTVLSLYFLELITACIESLYSIIKHLNPCIYCI